MNKYLVLLLTGFSLTYNTLYNNKTLFLINLILILLIAFKSLKKTKSNTILNISVLGFLTTSWIAYFLSQTANLGLPEMMLETSIWILFLFISNQSSKKNTPKFNLIFIGLICFAILESLFGIGQFILRDESRIAGTFLSWYNKAEYFPNALGLFLVLTTPLIHLLKRNWLKNIAITVSTLALLLSFSRGALIVFFIQTLIISYYYLSFKQKKQILNTAISILVAFTLFIGLNQYKKQISPNPISISQKYSFKGTEKITSLNERAQFMKGSLQLIKRNPIWGTGPDSFSQVYPAIQPLFLANAPHPHNWLLKIGVERGLISLIFFTSIIIYFVYLIFKNQSNLTDPRYALSLISLIGAFAHNLIDFNFNFSSNYLIFIILLSFIYLKNKPKLKTKKIHTNIILLVILIICFGKYAYSEIQLKASKKNYDQKPAISKNILSNLNYQNSNYILNDIFLKEKNYTASLNQLKQQTEINKYDAIAYNQLGDLSSSRKEKNNYYNLAIQADPMNNWIYYTNFYKNADYKTILADKEKTLKLLSQYLQLAKLNIHYTAQHDNIQQAQKVAAIFYQYTKNKQFLSIQQDLKLAQKTFSSD